MIEKLRRSGQRVVVEVEVETEEYNERSEELGRHRDSETEAASESKKTSLAFARQDVGRREREIERKKPSQQQEKRS
jgi:hypothetical protein